MIVILVYSLKIMRNDIMILTQYNWT